MSSLLTLSTADIRAQLPSSYYARGLTYFLQGQVLNLHAESRAKNTLYIHSEVQGSKSTPYTQNIIIAWNNAAQLRITGHCSCPVGHNCKHVVAACLQYQSATNKPQISPEAVYSAWLDNLEVVTPPEAPAESFIVYLLNSSAQTGHPPVISLAVSRYKKAGGLTKGQLISLSDVLYYKKGLPQVEDRAILVLLQGLQDSHHSYGNAPITLAGEIGVLALYKMLQTGRLYWQDGSHPALQAGAARELSLAWQQHKEVYQLKTTVTPSALLLLTDPPLYLDEKTSTLGEFNSPITLAQLQKYLAAPPVPAADAETFSRRLLQKTTHPLLPALTKIALTEVRNVAPTPVLRLVADTDDDGDFYFIELLFLYGEHRCLADAAQTTVYETAKGLYRIQRDLAAEQQAITRLEAAGFYGYPPVGKTGLCFESDTDALPAYLAHWEHFLQHTLPELKQAGWQVEQADDFKLDFQTAGDWTAEIDEPVNDWFAMRFHLDIDGQTQALLPLIMPLLQHYSLADLPETLHLPLGEQRYLSLPSEKLKPVLGVLLELFDGGRLDEDGALHVSRFQAGSLAELEPDRGGLFSISGGEQLRELAQKLNNFNGIEQVALPDSFQAKLRPYQQQGLNWLQFLREYQFGGILADDMGLGKTIQTLAHLLLEKQAGRMTTPCLIVAPTSLMSNWRREAARFTPDLRVLTLQGAGRKQQFDKMCEHDLILTTYPLLPRDEEILLQQHYHYLVLDEAQTVKNPASIAARLVRKINARHRLCLTGTPMENHLGELWAQFDFLLPGLLGDSAHFKKHYRTPIENQGQSARKTELARRIAPFMLRRTKQAVASELPPKTEIIRSVSLHPKQAMLYESIRLAMEEKVRAAIAEKGLARSHITILDALLKLRQTCCDPRTLPLENAQKINESAKLDLLLEMLTEQLEEGRRILVFSQFTRMIALIEDALLSRKIACTKLTGQTKKRDEAIEQFKSGAVNVFLISLKAGGVGLNLTEADTVILYDPWWNPAVESQAADRVYRIGQDKPVFVYKLVTENTVEEKILAMQERKRALANSLYQDGAKEESLVLTADDLSALFAPL